MKPQPDLFLLAVASLFLLLSITSFITWRKTPFAATDAFVRRVKLMSHITTFTLALMGMAYGGLPLFDIRPRNIALSVAILMLINGISYGVEATVRSYRSVTSAFTSSVFCVIWLVFGYHVLRHLPQ